jgi:hypothetical protein
VVCPLLDPFQTWISTPLAAPVVAAARLRGINHSPTGDPKKVSEMFGYAESTPIDIREVVVELEAPKD